MSNLLSFKYVSMLPDVLERDAVYYVKKGSTFDMYVTNGLGLITAYPHSGNIDQRTSFPNISGEFININSTSDGQLIEIDVTLYGFVRLYINHNVNISMIRSNIAPSQYYQMVLHIIKNATSDVTMMGTSIYGDSISYCIGLNIVKVYGTNSELFVHIVHQNGKNGSIVRNLDGKISSVEVGGIQKRFMRDAEGRIHLIIDDTFGYTKTINRDVDGSIQSWSIQ